MNDKDLARFLNYVEVNGDGCWIWIGGRKGKNGYGEFRLGSLTDGTRRIANAHRLAYEHWVGPIPHPLHVDHLCRIKQCVCPDHLEAVTAKVNNERNPVHGGRGGKRKQRKCQDPTHTWRSRLLKTGKIYQRCRDCERDYFANRA